MMFSDAELADSDRRKLMEQMRITAAEVLKIRDRFADAAFAPVDGVLQALVERLLQSAGRTHTPPDQLPNVVPRERWPCLGRPLSLYVLRSDLRGTARLALIEFASDLRQTGRGLVGDVVAMGEQEVLELFRAGRYGAKADRWVQELRRLLASKRLHLGMRTVGWSRPDGAALADKIEANRNGVPPEQPPAVPAPTRHLRLV